MFIPFPQQYLSHLAAENPDNAHTLPAAMYVHPDFHTIDKTSVIGKSWQLVAHISQLQKTGDHVVADVADKPVLLVKTKNEKIKAFYNVCRHRGGPLALKNGHAKTLMCQYHGWNYTLDGQLKSAPEMHSTPGFDVCQYQLPEIKCDSWQGFIFISFIDDVPALSELMRGIRDTIKPIDLKQMRFERRDEFIINCNWKVYVENFLEGYHLPHVHPGLNKLLDYRSYQTILHDWHSYQFSPIDNQDSFYGEGLAHYYFIYPNTMLNILPNRLQTNQILPISHNKTRILFDYYYAHTDSAQVQTMIKQDLAFSNEVQDEDIGICEAVQKGLNSGSYERGRLCIKRESAVLHFQQLLRTAYRQYNKNHADK